MGINKATTQATLVKKANLTLMEQVCELLEWSPVDYCEYQYEQYEAFVKLLCTDCPGLSDKLRHSPVFSGFWVNEWAMRDRADFLPFARDMDFDRDYLEGEYRFNNNVEALLHDEPFYKRFESILKLI